MRATNYGGSASVQAVTRVNAEQASKRTMRGPTRYLLHARRALLSAAFRYSAQMQNNRAGTQALVQQPLQVIRNNVCTKAANTTNIQK